ncbi:hypothetical protein BKA70DRAFT_1398908, partial [Coprinopsis sp. MPI-PUGE-AT-0042]
MGTAGCNSPPERVFRFRHETEKWEKGKRREGEKSGVPMGAPNVASGPTQSTLSSARAAAATNATRSRSQSTPFDRSSAGSANPSSGSLPLPPKKHARMPSRGPKALNTTARRLDSLQYLDLQPFKRIISSHSSRLIEPSSLLHCACFYQHQTIAQPTSRRADAGGSCQGLIDAVSSQIDAFGKQVEVFRVERERCKEVVGCSGTSRTAQKMIAPREESERAEHGKDTSHDRRDPSCLERSGDEFAGLRMAVGLEVKQVQNEGEGGGKGGGRRRQA